MFGVNKYILAWQRCLCCVGLSHAGGILAASAPLPLAMVKLVAVNLYFFIMVNLDIFGKGCFFLNFELSECFAR